jgi:VTC domain
LNGHSLAMSPGLFRSAGTAPAFEVKFLLTEAEAAEVEQRLRGRLASDPHADGNGTYRVTSVYFDTPQFDVYRRTERYRRRKYRVRRYGTAPSVFLERKYKNDQEVRKRRTALALTEVASLTTGHASDWPGAWFASQLTVRGLRPVCRVSYDRIALVGACHDGPIRVTFDRKAHGAPADGLTPVPVTDGPGLIGGEVITEFKFLSAMPAVFKDVIEALRLNPRPVSKYRRCVEAVGLVTENGNA